MELWKLPRNKKTKKNNQTEMECLHLTVYRKTPKKGLIGPGNVGFPSGIDDLRMFATDAGLHSLIYVCWELCQ